MQRGKSLKKAIHDSRPHVSMKEIGKLMGINRATVYRYIDKEWFSLEGIPVTYTTQGKQYDMEAIFQRLFASANKNTISLMMFQFIQSNKRVRKKDGTVSEEEGEPNGSRVEGSTDQE